MKTQILILLFPFLSFIAEGQTSKPDRKFDHWDYYKAATLFEKKVAKKPNADDYFKLGECYRKMNNFKAEEQDAYDHVNSFGQYSDPEFYYHYGQVLRTNGLHEKSRQAFMNFQVLSPHDPRIPQIQKSWQIMEEDAKSDQSLIIENMVFCNTEFSDFSPVFFGNSVVFTSSRKSKIHRRKNSWNRQSYFDLYSSKIESDGNNLLEVEPFGGKNLNRRYHDGPVSFSKNNDTMYFSRVDKFLKGKDRKEIEIERIKLFSSVFLNGKWQKAKSFQHNSDQYSLGNPCLSNNGKRLYFVSDMTSGYGGTDIYYSDWINGSWSKPVNAGKHINTINNENFPSLDNAENLYFSSDGYAGFGGFDLCVAKISASGFNQAHVLKQPINSSYDDIGILVLDNNKKGYFSSNRKTQNVGDDDILYFDFTNLKDTNLIISDYIIGWKEKKDTIILTKKEIVNDSFPTPIKVTDFDSFVDSIGYTTKDGIDFIIYFDFDKYFIRENEQTKLDQVKVELTKNPSSILVIGGHTDSYGTPEYNMVLSQNRNNSVITYLKKNGIDPNRVQATAYGLTKLVNECTNGDKCTRAQNQLNRRVEMKVVKKKS
jgi:outer membrane protein OmpA-like peptidoglycan-associated protein/tetratricopeptide (TPR) repeat protein